MVTAPGTECICKGSERAALGGPPDRNQELQLWVTTNLRQPLREGVRGINSQTSFSSLPPVCAGLPLGNPNGNQIARELWKKVVHTGQLGFRAVWERWRVDIEWKQTLSSTPTV